MDDTQRKWQWIPRTLIALGCLMTLQASLNAAGMGRIEVKGKQFDAGMIRAGQAVEHRFSITNYTLQTVDVKTQPSCGCTLVEKPGSRLSPFSQMPLTAHIETAGMKPGQYKKSVTLKMQAGPKDWEEVVTCQFRIR